MSKIKVIGTYVGILAFIAIALGEMVHADRTDPSRVATAHIAVRGVVIAPFRN